jgi:hypothetical protein
MTIPTYTSAPASVPSRAVPATFSALTDPFIAWEKTFRNELSTSVAYFTDSVTSTGADAVSTAADAVSTAADAVSTAADVVTATTQAGNASTSASQAAASYDSFDDRYLGAKASNPTLDNDGNALITGALYFNSTSGEMRAWSGAAWAAAYLPAGAYLTLTGGAMTGAITTNSTFDGVDVGVRDAVLTATTITANGALPKAGGTMTGNITMPALGTVDGVDVSVRDGVLSTTTTTANNALPKAGGNMTGAITSTAKITATDMEVKKVGDTALLVKALSSGAGNDDDASLVLDGSGTGEVDVQFKVDGVSKATIQWYDVGPDLNIMTSAGTNGNIDFQPNEVFAMRVAPGGNVGINDDTPAQKLSVTGNIAATGDITATGNLSVGSPPDNFPANNASGSGTYINSAGRIITLCESNSGMNVGRHTTVGSVAIFYYSGSSVGDISVTGSGTAYNVTSDYRLKENVSPIQGASEIVKAMRPCTYTHKYDDAWYDGFLAHELQELHPRAVTGEKDAMQDEEFEVTPAVLDEGGAVVTEAVMGTRSVPKYQGVDYSKLTPILTAALQEALNKIDALEIRLAALE